MHGLQKIFPPTEFALLAVILALPLLGAIVNGIFGKRLGKEAVPHAALFMWARLVRREPVVVPHAPERPSGAPRRGGALPLEGLGVDRVSARSDMGSVPIDVSFAFDALNGVMSLVATASAF
ncbi:MAG: hypothetical protein U0263_09705 [Polyangiaceae bacterium]